VARPDTEAICTEAFQIHEPNSPTRDQRSPSTVGPPDVLATDAPLVLGTTRTWLSRKRMAVDGGSWEMLPTAPVAVTAAEPTSVI
jgi:hypothetical protein